MVINAIATVAVADAAVSKAISATRAITNREIHATNHKVGIKTIPAVNSPDSNRAIAASKEAVAVAAGGVVGVDAGVTATTAAAHVLKASKVAARSSEHAD